MNRDVLSVIARLIFVFGVMISIISIDRRVRDLESRMGGGGKMVIGHIYTNTTDRPIRVEVIWPNTVPTNGTMHE